MANFTEDAYKNLNEGDIQAINDEICFNGRTEGWDCNVKGCKARFNLIEELARHQFIKHPNLKKKEWRVICGCPGPHYKFKTYIEAFLHIKKFHFCFRLHKVLDTHCGEPGCYIQGGNQDEDPQVHQHPPNPPLD